MHVQARWACSFALVKALLSVHTGVHFAIFRAHIALISLLTPSLTLSLTGSHYIHPFVCTGASGPERQAEMRSRPIIVNNYFISRLRLLKEIRLFPEESSISPPSRWVCDASVISAD